MGRRRDSRHRAFPTPVPPQMLVLHSQAPAEEARLLKARGAVVLATASEARALFQRVVGNDLGSRSLSRRRPTSQAAAPASEDGRQPDGTADEGPDLEPAPDAEPTVDAEPGVDAEPPVADADGGPDADGGEADPPDEPALALTEQKVKLDEQVARLERAAYEEDCRLLDRLLEQQQDEREKAERVRALATNLAVFPVVAVVVTALLSLAPLALAIVALTVPVAIAAVVVIRQAGEQAAVLDGQIDGIDAGLRSHPGATRLSDGDGNWVDLLAELQLPPVPSSRLADAIDTLRQRGLPTRAARAARSASSRRFGERGTVPARPVAPSVAPPVAPTRSRPELVVVLDDGLYVGQRIALRDMAEKLATFVPLLVLTKNERLWRTPGRPG